MSFFGNLGNRTEDIVEDVLVSAAGEVAKEAIKKVIKDLPPHPVFVTYKMSARAANAFMLSRRSGGVYTVAFWSSTGSAGLYTASALCQLGSNIVVYVNCSRFAPLLTAAAVATEHFGDKVDQFANGNI
jgi:hypothetical protein